MGFFAHLTCSTLQCLNLTAQLEITFQTEILLIHMLNLLYRAFIATDVDGGQRVGSS